MWIFNLNNLGASHQPVRTKNKRNDQILVVKNDEIYFLRILLHCECFITTEINRNMIHISQILDEIKKYCDFNLCKLFVK